MKIHLFHLSLKYNKFSFETSIDTNNMTIL